MSRVETYAPITRRPELGRVAEFDEGENPPPESVFCRFTAPKT